MKLQGFWESWISEYLPTLRERHSLQMKAVKGEVVRSPVVGEVVIVKEDNMPRGSWKLGRIVNLINSEIDGIARAATLIMNNGKQFRRPFRLLYPLEQSYEARQSDTDVPLSIPPSQLTSGTIPSKNPSKYPSSPPLHEIITHHGATVGDVGVQEELNPKTRMPRKCAAMALRKINEMQQLQES